MVVTTSTPVTKSVLGIGLIVKPLSTGVACGLAFSKRITFEKICEGKINKKRKTTEQKRLLFLSTSFEENVWKKIQSIERNMIFS